MYVTMYEPAIFRGVIALREISVVITVRSISTKLGKYHVFLVVAEHRNLSKR